MGFASDMRRFIDKVTFREAALFNVLDHNVLESIVEGSSTTGAPGQPVRSGRLKKSWRRIRLGRRRVSYTSDAEHAIIVEDNLQGVVYRNHGSHSVKLTRLGWPRLVNEATIRVKKMSPSGVRLGGSGIEITIDA